MKIEDIKRGDVLSSTDANGTGYYLVRKVCKVTIKVQTEQGDVIRAYPHMFERRVGAHGSEYMKYFEEYMKYFEEKK